jgi:hypothetical protein
MFVGRKEELKFLNNKYISDKAEFVVLYGRRRIGKTALISEFIRDKPNIFYSAVQITDSVQLEKMSSIVKRFFDAVLYSDRFSDWEMLFRFISDSYQSKEKLILVMDEFPYMAEGNKSISSILQKIWDHYFSNMNIMIIICGSSMSFMEKEVLSEKNPLYGRSSGILKIGELDFESSREFMGEGDLEEHLNYYSAFSGVPYYLSLINPALSFGDNIKANILRNGSVLFNEVEFLLKQELREVNQYNAIIESIALGDTRLNDIYQKTGIEHTKLPYYLNSLMNLGIVRKEFPATIKIKEQAKKRSGIYRIDNSYFRFYYNFVYPYISEIMEGNEDIIFEDIILNQLPMFISIEFERVAIEYLRQMVKEKKIPLRPIKIGRWWNKDSEIDLIAFDTQNRFLFGECKWRNKKTGLDVLNQLKAKIGNVNVKPSECYFVFFSKSGFTVELIEYVEKETNIFLVDYSGSVPKLIIAL